MLEHDHVDNAEFIERLGLLVSRRGRRLVDVGVVSIWNALSPELSWRFLIDAVNQDSFWSVANAFGKACYSVGYTFCALIFFGCKRNGVAKGLMDNHDGFVWCPSSRMYPEVLRPVVGALKSMGRNPLVVTEASVVSLALLARAEASWVHRKYADVKALLASLAEVMDLCFLFWASIKNYRPRHDLRMSFAFRSKLLLVLLIFRRGLEVALMARFAQRLAAQEHIKYILSCDVSDPRVRVFQNIFQQSGKLVFEQQFAVCGAESVEWRFSQAYKLFAWGEKSKQILIGHGVPEDSILVSGCPRYDFYQTHTKHDCRKYIADRYHLGSYENLIVVACTYHDYSHRDYASCEVLTEMEDDVVRLAAGNPNCLFVMKAHPHDQSSRLASRYQDSSRNLIFVDGIGDSKMLVGSADVFIGFGTTVTIDACVAGLSIICPNYEGWPFNQVFAIHDFVRAPACFEELVESFAEAFKNKTRRECVARQTYLEEVAGTVSELSSLKIATCISESIRGRQCLA